MLSEAVGWILSDAWARGEDIYANLAVSLESESVCIGHDLNSARVADTVGTLLIYWMNTSLRSS